MLERPPTPYLAIYRANMVQPEAPITVIEEQKWRVLLSPGGFEFSFSFPIMTYSPPSVWATTGTRRVGVPPGAYLVVELLVDMFDRDVERESALLVAEVVALLQLRQTALGEKVYEGFVNPPDGFVVFPAGGSFRLTARQPVPPADVAAQLAADLSLTRALPPNRRDRLRLAARWLVRAEVTPEPIDRFLMLWTVLEIYPMEDSTDIKPISELLAQHLAPALAASEIKTRLDIGRMFGVRSDIVHHGKAFVSRAEQETFEDMLSKLSDIAATCLRVLAGIPTAGALDRWVQPV